MTPFPYRIHVRWSEADGSYVGEVPAIPGAGGDGPTMEEAIARAQESARELLAVAREFRDPIPASDVDDLEFSGQIRLRMPKSMHCALATAAEREGVSLNQYMVTLLSAQMQRQPLGRFMVTPYSLPTQVTIYPGVAFQTAAPVLGGNILVSKAALFRSASGAWEGTALTPATSEPMSLKA